MTVYGASPTHGVAHIGVSITDRAERRKGDASDALCLVLRHLFHERRYHKAQADVRAFNEPSLALFRRLGFRQEGRLREVHFASGRYWDTVLVGLTAGEFDTAHAEYRLDWDSVRHQSETR